MDVQDQALRPSGKCAKVCDRFCRYGDVAFNLDSHVVAVAEKKFFHILDCVGRVSHVSSRSRRGVLLPLRISMIELACASVILANKCVNRCPRSIADDWATVIEFAFVIVPDVNLLVSPFPARPESSRFPHATPWVTGTFVQTTRIHAPSVRTPGKPPAPWQSHSR